jgi:hypothetical protein
MRPFAAALALALVCMLALGAAAGPRAVAGESPEQRPALPGTRIVEGVPHVVQKPDFCGEACVSMALATTGRRVSQDEVFERSGLDPALGRGCFTPDLYRALLALGVPTPSPWIGLSADSDRRDREVADHWRAVKAELARGNLVIPCMRYDATPAAPEHFRLLVGYEDAAGGAAAEGVVVYHEPAVQRGAYRRMPVARFLATWPLSDGRGGRFLVRFVVPGARPATATRTERRADGMRRQLGPDFRVAVEGPFAVAGDLAADDFERLRAGTIRWAYDRLTRDFFDGAPFAKSIAVYLFRDEESYRGHARRLFGDEPSTPYGYYSSRFEALVMNIATGGGTLVHEMVHPLLANDFPAVPSWFNEGLASLFEQCTERDGRIAGLVNWRLAGLQRGLAGRRLCPLSDLMSTTTSQFYGDETGLNYAQARYLMYWLQERGVLRDYYRRFRGGHAGDPSGIRTLEHVLGDLSIDRVDAEWRRFVRTLGA